MRVSLPVKMSLEQRTFTVNQSRTSCSEFGHDLRAQSGFKDGGKNLCGKRRLPGPNRHSPVDAFEQHGQLRRAQCD